jgi:hypothetical protein
VKLSEKNQRKVKKKLTQEMKIDNLEKFAKTSLAAEVILDRLKQGRKEIERVIGSKQQIQTTTAHQVRGHESGLCRFRP